VAVEAGFEDLGHLERQLQGLLRLPRRCRLLFRLHLRRHRCFQLEMAMGKWERIWCSKRYGAHVHILNLVHLSCIQRHQQFYEEPLPPGEEGGRVLHKIGAAVRCEMDAPDLKCAHEHRTPLSTRYVPWVNTHQVLLPHTHTHDKKITPSGHPFTLVGMDLPPYPYPRGYESPIGSPVPTKIKHLSKYYITQMSSISI
jgi:hypothetical protein